MALNPLQQEELLEVKELLDEEVGEEQKERFRIGNLEQAAWAMRKIAALHKQIEEVDRLADAEIARIENWRNKERESHQKSISFFESLLAEYLHHLRQQDPKAKIRTPYGYVSTRKQPPKWKYNEEETLAWLKKAGKTEHIRVKEYLDKSSLKKAVQVAGNKAVDENGEVVPGIVIEEQPEKVVVKVEV